MKKRIIINLFFLIILSSLSCNKDDNSYYIDAQNGNDKNTGLSPQEAWATTAKASAAQYKPGDKLLLKGGQVFQGSLLLKSVAGNPDLPVIISSYGDGKAIIQSGDSTAIRAINCNYLQIENLVCKGSGRLRGNNANGLDLVENTNLVVNKVEVSGYLFSGIGAKGGSDLRITNCYAHDNGFSGIYVNNNPKNSQKKFVHNVYIGNSVAENNPGCPAIKKNHSGNGILVGGVQNALIEYCEAMNNGWDMPRDGNGPVGIWAYMSDSVIIQNCYSHHNKTSVKGHDGGGFDFDGGITNSVMQYNLSAYNEGAGYGLFQYGSAEGWNDNIVRYNISFHDGIKNSKSGFYIWTEPGPKLQMKNLQVYNNTVINKFGHGAHFTPGHYENFVFENNIFLLTGKSDNFIGGDKFSGATFDKNLYYNSYRANKGMKQLELRLDKNGLLKDPLLILPTDKALLNYNAKTINAVPFFNRPLAPR